MGHRAFRCHSNVMFCGTADQQVSIRRSGLVEGEYVRDVVLDTGCSQAMVRQDLVPVSKRLVGEAVTVRCAHGDTPWLRWRWTLMELRLW